MKRSLRPRKTATLPESIQRQLHMYVLAAANGLEGWTGGRPYASALRLGAGIGPLRYFPGKQMASVNVGPAAIYYVGSWVNVKNRYLGLRFKIKGKTHFGWARLSVQVQNHTVVGTLTGYAYETIPGKAIKAGQTKDDDAAIHPASLGHLARGA